MKFKLLLFPAFFILFLLWIPQPLNAQYNTLWIPDTLSGTHFNLNLRDTFDQICPGNQTITAGINEKFWGPTLIFNQGDTVHMNVHNYLNDSTTIHWHGMHLPAVMDGGPHQVIPPNTIWQPYWKVTNHAATYWYHPHLHMMSEDQITKGLGGFIIVRDAIEAALPLPRTYGVDDIPLALTDRDINSSNQFSVVPYGDSMMVNGTLRPQYSVPAQVIRLRILDAAIERSYNIGFSDGRTFYVITTDGGLVNAPVPVTRFLISPGERVEILVNCTGQANTSVDLMSYNASISQFIGGGENFQNGPFANYLGHLDFRMLHLNIGAQTSSPITTIPSTLTTNTFYTAASANYTRIITLSDSTGVPNILGPNAFILSHLLFNYNYINYTVPLNNIEIWQLTSSSVFAHPFHIHDVEFSILTINGNSPPAEQQGWKDVVLVKGGDVVKFIARFDDYSDSIHPFMYHCHIALHEDEGMMGQFIVSSNATGIHEHSLASIDYSLYPNPATHSLFIQLTNPNVNVYYVTITNAYGKTVMMLPQPQLQNGIDVSSLAAGTYFVQLMDNETKTITTRKFIKQ
jgi:blue copper oxidase